jgi:hypothetical protein
MTDIIITPILQVFCLLLSLSTATISLAFLVHYRDKYPLSEYNLSTLHALFATIYGIIAYLNTNNIHDISYTFIICGHVTIGYFFVDLYNIIYKGAKQHIEFIMHHIVFTLIILWMIYGGVYHMFGAAVITTEISTIVLNQYHVIIYYSKKDSHWRKYIYMQIGILTITFFLSRIVFLTNLVVTNYQDISNDWILVLCGLFSLGINYFWFYKLIKKIINIISNCNKQKQVPTVNEHPKSNLDKLD